MYKETNVTTESCSPDDYDQDQLSSCVGWKFQTDLITSTAVEDFEMVCGNKSRKSLTQTMYMVGMLIGIIIH